MKKLLLYACCISCLFGLCACEPEDLEIMATSYANGETTPWGTLVADPEPENPYPLYVFPALKAGQPDFAIHLTNAWNFGSEKEFRDAPGYSKRLIIVSIYSLTCKDCAAQAPYFERLARQFKGTNLEFAILFMENDKDAIAKLDWVQKIKDVNVYYNSDDFCRKGLCMTSPNVITKWIANSKIELDGHIGFPANPDEQEKVYATYVKQTQNFLDTYTPDGVGFTN